MYSKIRVLFLNKVCIIFYDNNNNNNNKLLLLLLLNPLSLIINLKLL